MTTLCSITCTDKDHVKPSVTPNDNENKNITYYVQTDFCYNCLQGRNVNFFVHVIKDSCQDLDLL